MENWDFDCPQFVDFAAALNSPSNEVFHDVSSDVQATATNERVDLGPKMATPKVKPNDPIKNFPFINFSTDDQKLATLSKLPARLSKSDGCINQIIKSLKTPEDKENPKMCKRRTSFSVNHIRKRRICPTTPNCLKRTVKNSKFKNAKTSEELEMQKIAELQNMLHKHLRLNAINLKRMKMNKAPFTLEKLPRKNESKMPTIKNNLTAPAKLLPISNRKYLQNNVAFGATTNSWGINNHLKSLQNKEKVNVVAKTKPPFNVLRDLNGLKKNNGNEIKKLPFFEKYNAHGGLKFLPHQEKTMPCPFSFDTSYASSCNASLRATNLSKIHASLSVSKNMPFLLEGKENLLK